MAWTSEDYEQAKGLVSEVSDPHQRIALQERIKVYEQGEATRIGRDPEAAGVTPKVAQKARQKAAGQRAVNPQLSGLGWMGAREGLDSLEHNDTFQAGMPETPTDTGGHIVTRPGGKREYTDRATKNGRDIRHTPSATMGDKQVDVAQVEAEDQASLPQASGHPQLYRPPELMPEHLDFATNMKARVEFEPSLDQFRADMGKALGARVMEMSEDSPEYKLYADSEWAKKYDQAKQAGIPLTRKAYMNHDSWQEQVASGAMEARDTAETALMGVGSGLSFGAIPAAAGALAERTGLEPGGMADASEQQRRHPVASIGGNIVGAANPVSAVGKLGSLANAALPAAKSTVGGIARAGGIGAGIGGLGALFDTTSRKFGEGIGKGDLGGTLRGTTPEEVTGPLAQGAVLGGVLGAGGEAVSRGAGAAVRALRRGAQGEDLAIAERAGASTSAVGKVRGTPGIEQNIENSLRSADNVTPEDLAVDKVKAPMANAGYQRSEKLIRDLGAENEAYNSSPEGKTQHPLAQLAQKLGEIVSLKQQGGKALPLVKSEPFRRALGNAVDPVLVTEGEARALIQKEGGWLMEQGVAKELGLEARRPQEGRVPPIAGPSAVTAVDGKRGIPATPPPAGKMVVVAIPRKVNAARLSQIVNDIDEAADVSAGASASKKSSRVYKELTRAIRGDQGQWKANAVTGTRPYRLEDGREVRGLAALKARHAEQLGVLEGANERSGLPSVPRGPWDKLKTSDKAKFEGTLATAGKGGTEGEAARRALAQQAGVLQELREIAGTKVVRSLRTGQDRQMRGLNSSFARTVAGELAPGTSIRLDPAMRRLALSADELSPDLRELLASMRRTPQSEGPDALRQGLGLRGQYAPKQRTGDGPRIPGTARHIGLRPDSSLTIGLRGGNFGARVGSAAGSRGKAQQKLSDEDQKNLVLLISSAEGAR